MASTSYISFKVELREFLQKRSKLPEKMEVNSVKIYLNENKMDFLFPWNKQFLFCLECSGICKNFTCDHPGFLHDLAGEDLVEGQQLFTRFLVLTEPANTSRLWKMRQNVEDDLLRKKSCGKVRKYSRFKGIKHLLSFLCKVLIINLKTPTLPLTRN